jgi:hypothetical protein
MHINAICKCLSYILDETGWLHLNFLFDITFATVCGKAAIKCKALPFAEKSALTSESCPNKLQRQFNVQLNAAAVRNLPPAQALVASFDGEWEQRAG